MAAKRKASIIIPTYNRANYLPFCLEAVTELRADPQTFEIVVVDNNSSDNTQEIVLRFAQLHPMLRVRYVHETKQGVSHARNRGVVEAEGEIACFLDDDSPPRPDWLNILLEEFSDPTVGCVGGPSILDYQGQEVPTWIQGDLQVLLSAYELPYTEPTPVTAWDQLPLACNMALRRKLVIELGFFRTDLDRCGGHALAAGDTEMADRVNKSGWKVMYVPNALVRHLVIPDQLKKAYIYQIGRGLAQSNIILTADPRPHMIARWFASDLWYATRMFGGFAIAVLRRKQLWFDDYMRFWMVSMRLPLRIAALLNGNPHAISSQPQAPLNMTSKRARIEQ